jgi:hypothetical protein
MYRVIKKKIRAKISDNFETLYKKYVQNLSDEKILKYINTSEFKKFAKQISGKEVTLIEEKIINRGKIEAVLFYEENDNNFSIPKELFKKIKDID